jgi:hypothetical protein
MLRALRKRRFGMLFCIVTGLMVSLTVAPARAADRFESHLPLSSPGLS